VTRTVQEQIRWLNEVHDKIDRAIGAEYFWMLACIWTAILLVPLLITVPMLWRSNRRIARLQEEADRG
jgi:hypothetical protein